MTGLIFETLHQEFGAKALGINLSVDLDSRTIQDIQDAMDKYSLLVFPPHPPLGWREGNFAATARGEGGWGTRPPDAR